jgi:hypothetical protein
MSRHPQDPHLFTVRIDGHVTSAIRAMSTAEAREYWMAEHFVIERPTPVQAFRIGSLCELGIENAKPEYAEPDDSIQMPLLPDGVEVGVTIGPREDSDNE